MDLREKKNDALMELAEAFDLPLDTVAKLPHLELLGDRELLLSGHRGILAYSGEEIMVSAPPFTLAIRGSGLCLRAMTGEELRVAGRITGVEVKRA